MTPLAHGVGSVQDLPVPQWLFLYGAGVVLVVSFAALALLWRQPLLTRHADGRPLPHGLSRLILSPAVRIVLGALAVFLLFVVFAAALVGERSVGSNLAPTFVYVAFWLGLVPLTVVFGNIWRALNPWRAAAEAAEFVAARLGAQAEPYAYPERLGRWPAALGLFLFAALELAYFEPADPRALALAIVLYSGATWIGALVFGSRAWFPNAEAFTVYFGLLARLAPFAVRDGRVVVRWPAVGLAGGSTPRPGTVAFVAVMLGSVAFDGFGRSSFWVDETANLGDLTGSLVRLAGLLVWIAVVFGIYHLTVFAAKRLASTDLDLAGAFVWSLVPIALVYAVSHYFSLLVIESQFLVTLASDPFGFGWDLFGTRGFRPNLAPFAPSTIWYVQVGTLVAGHVVGLAVAHDRALELFPRDTGRALRTQYPFLVLMVIYTVAGLYLLSQE